MPVDVPTEAQKPYKPYGACESLFYCRDPEVLIEGPAGTGKSRSVAERCHLICMKYPNTRILWVRKTRTSLTESILVTYERDVVPAGHPCLRGPSRPMRHSYNYPNGSTIVLGGMDRPERIMSTEYDMACAFEATELTENDWEMVQTRLRNGKLPYQQGVCDCNPGPPSHWLNQRANTARMTRLLSRHEDNPTVTPEYIAVLDALQGVRYLRLRLGQWAAAEGAVWEEWDAAVHVIDPFPIPADWQRVRVIDFGHTNPFVCQWWALDEDGRAYLYRELYHTGRIVADHGKQILELSKGEQINATVSDHDASDRATLQAAGIDTMRADKRWSVGREAVKARLRVQVDGKPRLMIMRDALVERDQRLADARKPVCTEQEIDGYTLKKGADGMAKEEPVKADDHGCDAMRYLCMYLDPPTSARLDYFAGERVWQPPAGATEEEAQEAWQDAMILDGLD